MHAPPRPAAAAAQELAETRDKFEVGLGEARFYHGLARQAQDLTTAAAAVGAHLEEMAAGLEAMQEQLGADSPLVAAALRCGGRAVHGVHTCEKCQWQVRR